MSLMRNLLARLGAALQTAETQPSVTGGSDPMAGAQLARLTGMAMDPVMRQREIMRLQLTQATGGAPFTSASGMQSAGGGDWMGDVAAAHDGRMPEWMQDVMDRLPEGPTRAYAQHRWSLQQHLNSAQHRDGACGPFCTVGDN